MRHRSNLIEILFISLCVMTITATNAQVRNNVEWLEDAVFYQIYPSSFMDSNCDGMGDINGITSKLDYIKSVGANVVWLNPVFESGWEDGGYDVIDFYKVDPRFGTNSDLANLIKEIHKRDMKICLDLVAGHSSNKCEWFKESSQSGLNEQYSDYYIWLDEISETEKENINNRNKAVFLAVGNKGKYVEANAPRGKYYQKNFYPSQPALNYGFGVVNPDNPWEQPVTAPGPQAVRRELKNVMAFWYDMGVDGFRVDMAASLIKNDPEGVEIAKLWQEIRTWMDTTYEDKALIAEWSNPTKAISAGFDIDFMIHFGYKCYPSLFFAKGTPWSRANDNGECFFDRAGKGTLDEFAERFTLSYEATKDQGYITLPTSNHDFQRPNVGSRNTLDQLKVAMTFYLTMPGVPFIYYGDEIAMKFPVGMPSKEGSGVIRTGARTPMQWSETPTAGFSTCDPVMLYLPVDTDGGVLTVEAQESDPNSMLNYVRGLLNLRKSSPALGNKGEWELISSLENPYPMIYKRSSGDQTYIVALNPSERNVKGVIDRQGDSATLVWSSGNGNYRVKSTIDEISMSKFSALIFEVK